MDAALAAAAVLSVVCPYACSIGGDVYILLYWAKTGELAGLNGSGRGPAQATTATFVNGIPRNGIRSVSVPGAVAGWASAHKRFGTLSWADVVAPAVRLAESGVPVHATLAQNSAERAELLARNPAAHTLFGGLNVGGRLVQPELAATLQRIAEHGAAEFYEGETAHRVVRASGDLGGLLAAEDLHSHESLWQQPITAPFRGCEVATMPPNSYGLTLLFQLLLSTEWAPGATAAEAALHGLAARRKAYAAAGPVMADPEDHEAAARALLAEAIAGRWTDAFPVESRDRCTTNVVAMDRWGNAVSLVQSVSAPYGAGVVVPGTGILLNNRMTGFTSEHGRPNTVGPRRRPAHTLIPCLVLRKNRPRIALGTPGAAGQSCTLAQILRRVLIDGKTLAAAIAEPRWSVDLKGQPIYESDMDEGTAAQLRAATPAFAPKATAWQTFGSVKAVAVEANGFVGVADGRREAAVAGH